MEDWINIISNNESVVIKIEIINNNLNLKVKLWNGNEKVLQFINYSAFKEKKSINEEIGDIIVQTESKLLEEISLDNIDKNGSSGEIKSIVFMNAWNDRVILEVLFESAYMSEN